MIEYTPHFPIQRIIVGVDEDGRSDNAIRTALKLGAKLDASVELVHAVFIPGPRWRKSDPVRLAAVNAEALTHAWEALRNHFRKAFPDERYRGKPLEDLLRVLPGSPAKLILDQASETPERGKLIVVGPHKSRGVLDFGSTARSLLAKSADPVWIQVEEPRDIRRILVPIDLSEESAQTMTIARYLAQALEAEVTVLHCFVGPVFAYAAHPEYPDLSPSYVVDDLRESTEKHLKETVESIDWQSTPHHASFEEAEPVHKVLDLQPETDLIVIGTHGTTGLAPAVLGSTAYGILKKATRSVLAVHHDRGNWLL